MKYTPTKVAGVTIIDLELRRDHRGFTWRSFCARDFAAHGLNLDVAQTNIVFNYTRGTVRGLHRTVPPHAEATLLRCTRGAIVAAAVDVRPDSLTYGDHVMIELTADDHRTLFLPPYVAHGFQTLVDDTEVTYHTSGGTRRQRAGIALGRPNRSHLADTGHGHLRAGRELALSPDQMAQWNSGTMPQS
ncbi:dTDP-4-dehydrorhamnose 3,5-epimerase family protein [Mycobacterium avium MAV_120809_2495]|nr:dTDP-4-dehydrorhamnose 3,5-epimerase family protein [Mycobacterium avium MAV_120809_2495]